MEGGIEYLIVVEIFISLNCNLVIIVYFFNYWIFFIFSYCKTDCTTGQEL